MGFGIGMGIGIGMMMAKQYQQQFEYQQSQVLKKEAHMSQLDDNSRTTSKGGKRSGSPNKRINY